MTTTDTHTRTVPRTSTGQSATDLVTAWSVWSRDAGVTISSDVARAMAKHIKGLIIARYSTSHIKYGLAIWTIQKMDNPLLSTQAVDDLTWKYATDTSAQARRWRARMVEQVGALSKVARKLRARRKRQARLAEEKAAPQSPAMRAWGARLADVMVAVAPVVVGERDEPEPPPSTPETTAHLSDAGPRTWMDRRLAQNWAALEAGRTGQPVAPQMQWRVAAALRRGGVRRLHYAEAHRRLQVWSEARAKSGKRRPLPATALTEIIRHGTGGWER